MGLPAGWLRGVRPYAVLIGLCVLLYVPGISTIPPLDRDEARFTQATRQMLETGDFLRIRFQDEARNKKPAGIYWLQAAAVSAFSSAESTAIWPYRLPSLLGAIAAVTLTFAFGAAMFGSTRERPAARLVGACAAILLASALGVVAEAHIAKADAALLAAITAGQAALGLVYLRARAGRPIAAWIAAAFWAAEIAAVLLKGPPGPALAVVTAASLSIADSDAKWLRGLRPVVGVLVSLAAIAPWLYAIEHVTDGHFLSDSLGQDLGMKLIGAQESHGGPPFTYLVLSVMTFWPGSWLLVPALVRAWRRHDATVERFLLAWLVPAWVILELVPTKLPHYVLPLYPALALLAALALVDGVALSVGTWQRRIDVAVKVLWCGVGLLLAVVLVGLPLRFGYHVVVSGIVGAVILLLLGAAMVRHRPGAEGRIALIAAMSLAFTIPATLGVVPGLDRLWLSRAAAGLVALHPPAAGMPLVAVGYSEPSLVFLLGTDLHLMTSRSAAEILAHGGEALVSSREEPLFRQAISARGLAARPLGSVPGLDYSNGQRMVLTLYQVEPG